MLNLSLLSYTVLAIPPNAMHGMTTTATNLFVDFIIAHPLQESIVNEGGINYNYVNQHVPSCRDQPYWFVSFDTRARDL